MLHARTWSRVLIAGVLLMLTTDLVHAREASGLAPSRTQAARPQRLPEREDAWSFDLVPYGWMPWTDGTSTAVGRTVNVHAQPFQAAGHLEKVPVMGYMEVRKGPLGIYGDLIFAEVGLTRAAVTSKPGDKISAALGMDSTLVIGELGGVLELGQWTTDYGSTAFDVLGGARYWYQNAGIKLDLTQTLDLRGLVIENNMAIARSGNVDWVDPLVGARLRHTLPNGHLIYLRGDVGGFGGGSQFTWNLAALYDFELRVGKRATYSGVFGYRLLDVDYSQGEGYTLYELDVLMQGPLVGLDIRF